MADGLFPWSCIVCAARADGALCAACSSRVRWIREPWCPRCGLPLASGPSHPCHRCATDPPAFDRLRAVACYPPADEDTDPIGLLVRGIKYAGRRALAATLAELMAQRFPFDRGDHDLIAPVPLHIERLRSRGFNQALLLAGPQARLFELRLDAGLLVRLRDTPPQVGLPEAERRQNVRRAFALRRGRTVKGLRVLLVDDVCTSTATARACAAALRDAGAASVDVLVAARALVH
jgi:ComF family protein